MGSRASVGNAWKRVDLAWLLLLFPSLPAVKITVTCNKSETHKQQLILSFFLCFRSVFLSFLLRFGSASLSTNLFFSFSFPIFSVSDGSKTKGSPATRLLSGLAGVGWRRSWCGWRWRSWICGHWSCGGDGKNWWAGRLRCGWLREERDDVVVWSVSCLGERRKIWSDYRGRGTWLVVGGFVGDADMAEGERGREDLVESRVRGLVCLWWKGGEISWGRARWRWWNDWEGNGGSGESVLAEKGGQRRLLFCPRRVGSWLA